jgi:hypothetical protein
MPGLRRLRSSISAINHLRYFPFFTSLFLCGEHISSGVTYDRYTRWRARIAYTTPILISLLRKTGAHCFHYSSGGYTPFLYKRCKL